MSYPPPICVRYPPALSYRPPTAKAPSRQGTFSTSPSLIIARMATPSKKPIHIKKSTTGTYTARAKAKGHTVQQQAKIDLAPGSKASPLQKKRANFARNAKKWSH